MSPREEVEPKTKNLKEIEDVIAKAIKKVNGRKENDLCKYIPMSSGGYMHHFTLRKMKNRQPHELGSLIEANLRRLMLTRFPYALIYSATDDLLHVVAVAHARRRPGYWRPRVGP